MIYLTADSMEARFYFGLEAYVVDHFEEETFLLWHTDPTLMLGRFQVPQVEVDLALAKAENIDLVRRPSGGGTIYTDPGSWQFTFIVPAKVQQIDFSKFVLPVQEALRGLGYPVEQSGRNDLLLIGRKVSGNAQYFSKGCQVHHGSILFDTDLDKMARCLTVNPEKFRGKGIASVRDRVMNLREYLEMTSSVFQEGLANLIVSDGSSRALTAAEILRIETDYAPKFSDTAWVFGQAPTFDFKNKKRYDSGLYEVALTVRHNRIQACEIQGDFFYAGDIEKVKQRFIGCPYEKEAVREVLAEAGLPTIEELFF